jgi:hypothetical protein
VLEELLCSAKLRERPKILCRKAQGFAPLASNFPQVIASLAICRKFAAFQKR